MQCVRFGPIGQEKPGIIDADGHIRDVSSIIEDFSGDQLNPVALKTLEDLNLSSLPIVDAATRLGPCVSGVSKIICIGLNYLDHIKETNAKQPDEPILFAKMCKPTGANDPIMIPKNSKKTDWEVELAIVIGKKTQHITPEEAKTCIAGFCVIDDLSERTFQFEHAGQWTKGKSCDGFAPLGPWLVTANAIKDPQNLTMWTKVNGTYYQQSNTNQMLFGIDALVSYISGFMTLYPGDVISSGTPPGVGAGMKPEPIFLKVGDQVEVGIENLGTQKHVFIEYKKE